MHPLQSPKDWETWKKEDERRPSKLLHYWDWPEYRVECWSLEETCCHSKSNEKPSADAGVKTSTTTTTTTTTNNNNNNNDNNYYYYLLIRIFHICISWWSFTGDWVTASLLKFPGLFSVFWPFSIMLLFGWSPLGRQLPSPPGPLIIL